MNPAPPIPVVCAVIVDDAGRVLACQRPPGKRLAGKWEFPGGKVHPGETPEQALIREISEELDVGLFLAAPLPVVHHHEPDLSIELIPYLAHIASGDPRAAEHTALRWLAPAELDAVDWAAADRVIVAHLGTLPRGPAVATPAPAE